MILMLAALVVVLGVPAALTWQGQRRRGSGRGVAAVAAVFFPVAWTVWYVADERPYGVS
ncbi:4-amino-4-deoxy-L-arabinose transferase-like glycosyltransferase [Nocardioides aromaticivorans]|uniref:4-amino-4-deoxy-L-arabinose transferase-like glycosyltransferase n=1 Tax=Nocardioides aromaticivorans TaxID=200618 RepID=A0A7Z0CQN2_9ACTN|nr:hypothetical protein [Nocardioides aromaticivorans]NYI47533.1 4-amino-4-deoxy-L-arabinose transferase-like glycosyltransferase [Nocardioides aromaticivorans]